MNSWLKAVIATLGTGAVLAFLAFVGDSAIARADQHWLPMVAFEQFQNTLADQEARKELRSLQRDIADVQYRLTNATGEERGRLEERLRVLLEQQAEIQVQLGETG